MITRTSTRQMSREEWLEARKGSSRIQCAKGGNFDKYANGTGTAIAYAWFLWEKGYSGDTVVRWFN